MASTLFSRMLSHHRTARIQLLTSMFNACNTALYLESLNEFPQHCGWIDHRLSDFQRDTPLHKALFSIILLFTAVLSYSNQISYSRHIDRIVPKPNTFLSNLEATGFIKKCNEQQKRHFIASLISAAYKAVTTATSLAALLKNRIDNTAIVAISTACGLGSLITQFTIYMTAFKKSYSISLNPHLGWIVRHLFVLLYNLPNTALYFNAGDEFLHHIKAMDHRLSNDLNPWAIFLLSLLSISSFCLFTATQRSYSKKMSMLFHTNLESQSWSSDMTTPRLSNSFQYTALFLNCVDRYTIIYKSFINYLSLIAVLYSLSMPLPISTIIAFICIPGTVYAQYAVLENENSNHPFSLRHALRPPESNKNKFLPV